MKKGFMISTGDPNTGISDHPPLKRDKKVKEEIQEIYLTAFNQSWDSYDTEKNAGLDRQSVAHRDGWQAVKREYVHDEQKGIWYRKGENPE